MWLEVRNKARRGHKKEVSPKENRALGLEIQPMGQAPLGKARRSGDRSVPRTFWPV